MEMMRTRTGPGRRGFSLIEVVVAMMIGTIGLLALSGLLIRAMTNNRMATDISIATSLARQKIEQIKLMDYVDVDSEEETNLNENGQAVTEGKYKRVITVTENMGGKVNLKEIDVTVYFSPTTGSTMKKAVVSTIIYP